MASGLLTCTRSSFHHFVDRHNGRYLTMEKTGKFAADDYEELRVFETLSTPIWVFDFDRNSVIWANSSALTLWGASTCDELASRDMSADTSPTVVQHLKNIRKRILNGNRHSERWTLYPNGHPRHCFLEYRRPCVIHL